MLALRQHYLDMSYLIIKIETCKHTYDNTNNAYDITMPTFKANIYLDTVKMFFGPKHKSSNNSSADWCETEATDGLNWSQFPWQQAVVLKMPYAREGGDIVVTSSSLSFCLLPDNLTFQIKMFMQKLGCYSVINGGWEDIAGQLLLCGWQGISRWLLCCYVFCNCVVRQHGEF